MTIDSEVWKKFEENNITHSAAHHLLAVLDLRRERGYARVTDVAKYLNITTGSASTNLKSLKQKGLIVEDDNRFLALSDQGQDLAKAVVARKEIFYKFLTGILGVNKEQAEVDACKTEHLLSHETSEKLLAFMQQHMAKGGSAKRSGESREKLGCVLEESKRHGLTECPVCVDHCLLEEC